MTTTDPLANFGTKKTHQSQPVPGRPEQVRNNAGGYVFQIDPVAQLTRFLTIGTSGGTFYVGENKLTEENANMVVDFTKNLEDHKTLVDTIVDISLSGRAKKQNPTLFALAIACQLGSTEGKQYARKQIIQVVRTGTHLFIFAGYLKQFGGWSRGLRREVGKWYSDRTADQLAYQLVKYRQREGYTHRDILRMTHPKVEGPSSRAAIDWAVRGKVELESINHVPNLIRGYTHANIEGANIVGVLDKVHLPWEALPDSAMNDVAVWNQMLDNGVPIGALLRQLPRLTKLDILPQMGGRTDEIVSQLLNPEALKKARIHPFSVLVALWTYRNGEGRGSSWTPTTKIIDGLDEMFYASFGNVEPTGKRIMNALDVSGSMASYPAGNLPLTAREASAALAMITVRTEPNHMTLGFTGGNRGYWNRSSDYDPNALTDLAISKRQRLDDVIRSVSNLPFGGTDCALPMEHARRQGLAIDAFVIYTDNETWAGGIHPFQALQQYRKDSGIDAKLVVVSMTPTKFSIADPSDSGMLDISGFDSATPTLISDFIRGDI